MAYSIQTAVSDGTLEVLDLSIKYMDKSHIFVYVDDVLVDGTAYSYVWLTDTRIQVVPAIASGSTIKVIRKTLTDEMWNEFSKGARFSTTSMDENFKQLLFLAQEYSEGIYVSDFYTDVDIHLKQILNLGDPVNDGDAVNLKTLKEYLPNANLLPPLVERIAAEEAKSEQLALQGIPTGNKVIAGFDGSTLQDNAWVHFSGRDTIGDGGGGHLRFLKNSTITANGITVYAITGGRLVREGYSIFGVHPEWAGAKGKDDTDDGAEIQATIDYAIPLGLHVRGGGKYRSSQPLVIPEYRTDPAVSLDFATLNVELNQLTYTGTTGTAIQASSPTTRVYIKKLIGVGGSNSTSGLTIIGQGDPQHRVDYVTGFGTDVNLLGAYSHTVWIGYGQDANVGVSIDGNANKIYAGRIGGRFTAGDIATDPTTCDIGIKVVSGVANEIHANIEYCKRTANSVGLYDQGIGTRYYGYLEGSNAYNLYAVGHNGRFECVSGTNSGPAGLYAENDNEVVLMQQQTTYQVTPADNNTTLTFDTPSKFETEGFAKIAGPEGYAEWQKTALTDVRNEILYSSTLDAPGWSYSALGSANWGAVTVNTSLPGFVEAGYMYSTQFTLPALPNGGDIYRVSQTNRITRVGPINYGLWVWVESGDVDIQVRIVEGANNKQSKQVVRLGASNKWVNVAARYMKTTGYANDVLFEIQFRTQVGAVVRIANAYLVTEADTYFVPCNQYNNYKANLKGIPVNGNTFENGLTVNGAVRNQIAPAISSGGQYLMAFAEYPVVLVSGGWAGNLFLQPSPIGDGHRIVVKRDGVAASGSPMQILPSGTTVDGSSATIDIAAPYTTLELIYSTITGGWLRLR